MSNLLKQAIGADNGGLPPRSSKTPSASNPMAYD
jgi:hypothetical protein